jgi:hypothetical protein
MRERERERESGDERERERESGDDERVCVVTRRRERERERAVTEVSVVIWGEQTTTNGLCADQKCIKSFVELSLFPPR